MQGIQLEITERNPNTTTNIASLDQFIWQEGQPIDASTILDDPHITPYCIDDTHQWVVFAVLPDDINLTTVPFVYQAQTEHALSLIAVSYDTFYQLADSVAIDPEKFVCIHNIGRCGSTLMVHALNEVDGIFALSEPDVFVNFIWLRHLPHPEQIRLLQGCFKLMYRPAIVNDASHYVLKLRNQCLDLIDLYAEAFPTARHVFMYRNLIDWLASLFGYLQRSNRPNITFTREQAIERMTQYLMRDHDEIQVLFDKLDTYTPVTYLTISILMLINRYLATKASHPDFQPLVLRYDELIANRESIMAQVLAYLGLPESEVESTLSAFERDSQAGTWLARDNAKSGNTIALPDDEIKQVYFILEGQPVFNHPDVILPDTLQ